MRFLVIGGTVFVGRHFVEAALARGHEVALFHRGQRGAELFPGLKRYQGDRDGGLGAIAERSWDAVVDVCGYVPRVVRQSVEHFASYTPQYLFVSTISVYAQSAKAPVTELSPLATLEDETVEAITGETYGGLKVLCEKAVLADYPEALIIRPGLIVGPFDPTNRFTYWVDRYARGGEVLAPNVPNQAMQLVDARDLAQLMVAGFENGLTGAYNATGESNTVGGMLDACQSLNPSSRTVWASEEFIAAKGLDWEQFPLLAPSSEPDDLWQTDSSMARAAGLTNRPLAESAADTWAWRNTLPIDAPVRVGLSREKERELLAELRG